MMLTAIKFFFSVLGRIQPKLAGRLAFTLFCTPIKAGKLSPEQRALVEKAESRLKDAKWNEAVIAGEDIRYYQFSPTNTPAMGDEISTVLLIHGWTSKAALMTGFVDILLESGLSVIAVDLPAHGNSSGRTLQIPKACAVLSGLQTLTGPWDAIVAHSFGGAVALSALSNILADSPVVPTQKLILISAPCSMREIFHSFGRQVGLTAQAQEHMNHRTIELSGKTIDEYHGQRLLQKINVPTLIIHDRTDKEINFSNAEEFDAAGGFVTLSATNGLGHRRILYDADVATRTQQFLSEGLAS